MPTRLLWIVPVAGVLLFLWSVSAFYDSRTGFSSLVLFGDRFHARMIPALQSVPLHIDPGPGYDGQFYAQIAIDPTLRNPDIDGALDLAPHRTRRILFSWTAHVAGGGDPARIVQAYAVQNIVAWLALAGILIYWFRRQLCAEWRCGARRCSRAACCGPCACRCSMGQVCC
jgi:hypothetical protein